MKKNNHFAYDWLIYVMVVILSVGSWIMIFNVRFMPKPYESLTLFYGGVVKDYSFQNDALNELKDNGVIKVELVSSNPTDTTFSTKFSTVGLNNSDVILISEEIASKTMLSGTFKELEENYSREFYVQEGKNYGIILSSEDKTRLSTYFYFENQNYILLVNDGSVNDGELTLNAYKLIEWMVNYEN